MGGRGGQAAMSRHELPSRSLPEGAADTQRAAGSRGDRGRRGRQGGAGGSDPVHARPRGTAASKQGVSDTVS